jgi:hypothetical protein
MIMRFYEFKTTKPLTPQQARINALKQQKERVSTQLKAEKDRQKKQKAVQAIQQNNQVLAKLRNA